MCCILVVYFIYKSLYLHSSLLISYPILLLFPLVTTSLFSVIYESVSVFVRYFLSVHLALGILIAF